MSKEQSRHYGYQRYYGITAEDFAKMFTKQGGKCAICGQPETSLDKNGNVRILAVDHCHTSGAVRELLCYACNSMLGQARDSIDTLAAGIEYLKRHSAKENTAGASDFKSPSSVREYPALQTGPTDAAQTEGLIPCAER